MAVQGENSSTEQILEIYGVIRNPTTPSPFMRKAEYDADGDGIIDTANIALSVEAEDIIGLEELVSSIAAGVLNNSQNGLGSKVDKETGKALVLLSLIQKLTDLPTSTQLNDSLTGKVNTESGKTIILQSLIDKLTALPTATDLTNSLAGKVALTDVYNALDQASAGKVLDARQGKALKDLLDALTLLYNAHAANTSNPHNVTKSQVGLGNVPNVDATNPANITQSANYRFSTDAEKDVWNAKSTTETAKGGWNPATNTPDIATLLVSTGDAVDVTTAGTYTGVTPNIIFAAGDKYKKTASGNVRVPLAAIPGDGTVSEAKLDTNLAGKFNLMYNSGAFAATETLGIAPALGTSIAVSGYTFFQNASSTKRSKLKTLNMYVRTAGTFVLKSLQNNGNGTVTVLQEVTLTAAATGLTAFADGTHYNDFYVPANGYLAIALTSGQAQFSYRSGTTLGYYSPSGNLTGTFSRGTLYTTNELLFSYTLENVDVVGRVTTNEASIAALQTGQATANTNIANVQASVTTLSLSSRTVTTGPDAPGSTSVTGPSAICLFNNRYQPPGSVSAISVDVGQLDSGQLQIVKCRQNYNGTIDIVSVTTGSVSGTGTQTVSGVTGLILAKNEFLAVQLVVGGARLKYNASGGGDYWYYVGTASGSGVTFTRQTGGDVYMRVTIQTTATSVAATKTALLEAASFSALPAGWSNPGGWTFAGGKASSSSTGLAAQLISGYIYGLDRRVITWTFQLTGAGSVVNFLTKPGESSVNAGSIVQVNAGDNTLKILNAYTGSNTPAVLVSQSLGFTLSTSVRYTIEIEKSGRTITVRLYNATGADYFEYTRTATPWGYSTYNAYGYDQGTLQGSPGVAVVSGAADIYSFDHRARGSASPAVYVLGDSITEGFGVTDAQKWPALLAAELGADQVQISGIGGAVTAGALLRLQSELARLSPTYVVVYLGSNGDASFAANIAIIERIIRMSGAIPVFLTVPSSSSATNAILTLPSDTAKVRLDYALTTNATAGGTRISTYYANTDANGNAYNDNLHPNAAGNAQMIRRAKVDAPSLFQ